MFRNSSFRWLFITCLIFFVSAGAAGALTLYANSYFWKLFGKQLLPLGLIAAPAGLAGVFVAGWLAKRLEKRTIAMIGLALIGVGQGFPVILRLADVIPLSAAIPTLSVAVVLATVGASMALIGFQSMMADAADEHEHLFFARREGLYFAGITTSAKASSGIGAFIAGVALDLIHFPHGAAATGANAGHPGRDHPQPRPGVWARRGALHRHRDRAAVWLQAEQVRAREDPRGAERTAEREGRLTRAPLAPTAVARLSRQT